MKAQRISKIQCKPQSNNVCCICGDNILPNCSGGMLIGNNAYPFGDKPDSRCCDVCNWNIVVPTRIEMSSVSVN